MILFYIIAKIEQFFIPYIEESNNLNSYNLIPTVLCLSIFNCLKIWHLFDFNPIYLFQIINQAHQL